MINKPKGILSNHLKGKPNLERRIREILGNDFQPINRLDRMTDGWIAFCNSERLRRRIRKNWRNTVREYLLISSGNIPLGSHKFYCKKHGHVVLYRKDPFPGSRLCISKVLYSKRIRNCYLVKVRNVTGFTHQVRVLIRLLRHYIIGDDLYKRGVKHINRLQLSAIRLKIGPFNFNDRYFSINTEIGLTRNIMHSIIKDYRGLIRI